MTVAYSLISNFIDYLLIIDAKKHLVRKVSVIISFQIDCYPLLLHCCLHNIITSMLYLKTFLSCTARG